MASLKFHLIMRSGPEPGKAYELTNSEIYIGRDIHNDVVINDAEVSRKHARMEIQAGGYVLEDLGSTNGTFVNGQRLMGPHVLRPNYEPLPEEKRSSRTLLLAGCGCLVVILCVIVAGGIAFDQLNLYCVTPFNTVTNILTNLLIGYPACQ
jgi:hypothetical protein